MLDYVRAASLALFSLLFAFGAMPAQSADQAQPASTSMADYHYVLHIDDMDPSKQTLILNNASNLLEAYPPGNVDVEIVAYGPGLRLLFADNVNKERIHALALSGVRFSACNNTLKGFTKLLGYEPKLNPDAKVVPGGIVRIGELVKQGYIYIKP
jgi:intracellular sulfur oxidation DsrE/DsrF family protein